MFDGEEVAVFWVVKELPFATGRLLASGAAGKQEVRLVDAEIELDVDFGLARSFAVRL